MRATDLIRKKREGQVHTEPEIFSLIEGLARGEVKDYQMSAWLMAAFLKGLSRPEMMALTRAMWKTGHSMPRHSKADYWVDKHSTGGVGDKLSLILLPLVASLSERLLGAGEVKIPMISGRALGYTGGTLDKLESVPGFQSQQTLERATQLLEQNGFCMIGQTADLAPTDKQIYSLRDATATVESIPLIVSSILSKKLAENLNGLVLDVKFGSGAFMETYDRAKELATTLVSTAKELGIETVALLTQMDEPIGFKVGNHLEVEECADFLLGRSQEKGLKELVYRLTGWMMQLASRGDLPQDSVDAEIDLELTSRRPFEVFLTMFSAQGGSWENFEAKRKRLRQEVTLTELRAGDSGYIASINARRVGLLLNEIGGGRKHKEDTLDNRLGFEFHRKVGDAVTPGEALATIYHSPKDSPESIREKLAECISFSKTVVPGSHWVREVVR